MIETFPVVEPRSVPDAPHRSGRKGGRLPRLALVIAGILVAQFILYWPSLLGLKVLLPVDYLSLPGVYLPATPEFAHVKVHDIVLSDLVLQSEPARLFAVSELRQGRLPIWSPFNYCGAPTFRHPLCPAWFLNYLIASPVVLAWSQVLLAVFAGVGAYAFFRRCLNVGFWPGAIAAWCFPLSGTFILWQGAGSPPVVACLPWVLLCVEQMLRRPLGWGGPALAVFTCVAILSAAPDVAGQVLLVSGLYALWRHVELHRGGWWRMRALLPLAGVCAGWALGVAGSMPVLLPLMEYSQTGSRMAARSRGAEERPPGGIAELAPVVIPEVYGTSQEGNARLVMGHHPESSAAAYAGLLATLVAAPLAWRSRRHRSANWFWLAIGFAGLGWCLNIPGLVSLMRLPGMNMMSFNRFTFATTFAILALAAIGLDSLLRGERPERRWSFVPIGLLAALTAWCFYRTAVLPEPLETQLAALLKLGETFRGIKDQAGLEAVQDRFIGVFQAAAISSALGIALWLVAISRGGVSRWTGPALGALMIGELLWFGCGFNSQCDPALYFPRNPMLEQVAKAGPGRAIGYGCLYPNVNGIAGLRDVRGYDAVDPARMVQLVLRTRGDDRPVLRAAKIQDLAPRIEVSPEGSIRMPPILDMLNVRYVILRGTPLARFQPAFTGTDYWAITNPNVLPRAFVPKRVETEADAERRLEKLSDPAFSPRDVAYVEQPLSLPNHCEGTATIEREIPRELSVSVEMKTPGLVVISDMWDVGWHAWLDGREVPIFRTNHAVRGVVVPEGKSRIEFRHEPASMYAGIRIAGIAAALLAAWVLTLSVWPGPARTRFA